MGVDYNEISEKYDDVRAADVNLIKLFLEKVNIDENTRVLDFGCGTGNYADKLQKITNAKIYGVEPSDGMRKKAQDKNKKVFFSEGNHESIPFPDDFFDFVYMTDVIHHIPEQDVMFTEIKRVLQASGKLCIMTQSHKQIGQRFYVKYFPSTAIIDKKRYPDIEKIIVGGEKNGFKYEHLTVHGEGQNIKVGNNFLELVRKKGYSMFQLIPEREYEAGLKELANDLQSGELIFKAAGQTLVWFIKK